MCNFYKIGNKIICRLGEFLFVISILVLVGSLLFVMVYALFFSDEYEYFDFNKNKELICNMSSLKIDVSKADNWSVDKNSFLKGSTSIPVTKCEIKD